jgi:aspartate racemase
VCSPDYVDISADDVFLQLAPISFDASTFEIWGALLNGARLAVMPPGHVSLAQIGEAISNEGITILWLTGGLFNLIVDERLEDMRPLKQLLIGGEALSVAHVEKALASLENTQLINGYGPTENTTFTCCHRIRRGEDFSRGVPIGRPIRGTRVKVVDAELREVPSGEEGELLAGGEGVALGYWNRPELTAERFVRDAREPDAGTLYYRTGDHVRSRHDGVIEFLGRRDGQVKLRGFRIELGEIEEAIRRHAGVRDCAVKVVGTGQDQGYLAAYVVRNMPTAVEQEDLSAHVGRLLPEHMWPGAWFFQEQLPLNPNGKVDRGALPDPPSRDNVAAAEQPATELERIISETWREVMDGRDVGLSVSFFDAGGNSLQLTRLHERLRRDHGITVPLTDLFQFPSVRSLAQHLAKPREQTAGTTGQNARGVAQRQALSGFRKPPIKKADR